MAADTGGGVAVVIGGGVAVVVGGVAVGGATVAAGLGHILARLLVSHLRSSATKVSS